MGLEKINKDTVMLLDIQYVKPNKKLNQTDYLYYIYKDLETKEKKMEMIVEPKMTIYFEKPEYRNHKYVKKYAEFSICEPRTVKYKNIRYEIAKEIGPEGEKFINECFDTGNYRRIDEVFLWPYSFGADIDIRMWYRYHWKRMLDNDKPKKLSKGFFDIEVDSFESVGLPSPETDPIDLVTIIDNDKKTSYTFALIGIEYMGETDSITGKKKWRMYNHRLMEQEYYSTHLDELQKEIHETFDENYPGMTYNFYFYKDEIKMIIHIWELINQLKLDMMGGWFITFDIPYFIDRIKAYGLNPENIMCHKDFPNKECYFKKDKKHFDIKNKTDFFRISSYTVFIDQMISYAAIRKSGSELRNYRLNYIAKKELKDEKLDYSDSGSIKTLSYNDYLKYIKYNIKDVLLLMGIENRTCDMDTIYTSSYQNMTPYEDIFKQTKTLTGIQYEFYMKQNIVPRNNVNAILNGGDSESDDEVTFEGALVGDPILIENFGVELYGKKSNSIFDYSIDLDMSAFYPSVIIAFNITENGLIFKVYIKAEQFKNRGGKLEYHGITDTPMNPNLIEAKEDSFKGDIGKEVADNYQCRNYLSFGYKWLNLPSINQLYKAVKKKLG